MPEDCIFLLFFDLGGGEGQGAGAGAGAGVQIGSGSYLFVQFKTRGCIKFCNHF